MHEIRPVTSDEAMALLRAMGIAFHNDPAPEADVRLLWTAELDRSRCVFEDGEIVATLGAYSLPLSVPGGVVPMGGTTWVTVRPTHRRRGLLRALMSAHFEDVRARGEPLAALWASESGIYGRFGYGVATKACTFVIRRSGGAFHEPLTSPGRVRFVEGDEALEALARLYARIAPERPGLIGRSPARWRRWLADPPHERMGYTSWRHVVYEEAGEVRGSASYRTKHRFDDAGITDGELMIGDLHGLDAAALRALWRLLLDVDLVRTVRAWNQPEDCELAWWLADPRQLRVSPRDGLWLRILDVPAALARRRYASEGHLVLGVRDSQVDANCGAFELEAGGEGAECKRSSAEPEVALDVRDLASLYLGGVSVQSLARAGRVAGDGAALQRMDRMFRWHLAPWCADSF